MPPALTIHYGSATYTPNPARATTIGRAPDCDLVIHNPYVSHHHARVTFTDDGWLLEDTGSANGLSINGIRTTSVLLLNSTKVTLAQDATIVCIVGTSGPSTPAQPPRRPAANVAQPALPPAPSAQPAQPTQLAPQQARPVVQPTPPAPQPAQPVQPQPTPAPLAPHRVSRPSRTCNSNPAQQQWHRRQYRQCRYHPHHHLRLPAHPLPHRMPPAPFWQAARKR